MHIEFIQTKGKKSAILKRVDQAAKQARDSGTEVDRGYQAGTVSRSMVEGAAKRFPANGQIAVIRPYRKKIMRSGEEKIRFDTLSEDGQNYAGCFYAYTTPRLAAELHRQNGYRVKFNDDSNYPQILECLDGVPLPEKSVAAKSS